MPRAARIVQPGVPHHITQRGVRRMQVFFTDEDYQLYMKLLGIFASRANSSVLAWCLMPNHVHLMVVPQDLDGLRATIAPLDAAYAQEINKREGWTGHLWQSRFASFPMDPYYSSAAARYIELNPVRAGIVEDPAFYRWSSASAHLTGESDGITDLHASREITDDWPGLLASGLDDRSLDLFRKHELTNNPLGSKPFIKQLEQEHGRSLHTLSRGRPKKEE